MALLRTQKSFERLPVNVLPHNYHLELKPDLAAFTFEGRLEITTEVWRKMLDGKRGEETCVLVDKVCIYSNSSDCSGGPQVVQSTSVVVMNCAEIEIQSAHYLQGDLSKFLEACLMFACVQPAYYVRQQIFYGECMQML